MNPIAVALIQIAISLLITAIIARSGSSKGMKAQGLDDFTFPTVSQDRSIPVAVGDVVIDGPNVLWYGDFSAHADKEGGSTFSKAVVAAYQYKLGIELAIAWGVVDSLTEVWFGEDIAWEGNAVGGLAPVIFQVNAPDLFGGSKNGGGVGATCEFWSGNLDQGKSDYMEGQIGEAYYHKGLSKFVWRGASSGGGSIGESTNIPPMKFRVQHYPNPLGTAYKKIGTGDTAGANPSEVIYWLLIGAYINVQTGTPSVPAIPANLIDTTSFTAAALTLYNEQMGISFQWQRDSAVREIINDILSHIDGYLSEDSTSGKLKLVLNRADYTVGTLLSFNESDIVEFTSFVRINPTAAANRVVATYTSPADQFKQVPINIEDLGNIFEQDMGSPADLDLHMFHNVDTAIQRGSWHLVQLSEGIISGTFRMNRKGYSLNIGQPIKISWGEFGVTDLVVRVIQKTLGGLDDRSIEIKFVQDVYGIGTAIYGPPTPTAWQDIFNDPVDISVYKYFDMPYFMLEKFYPSAATKYQLFLLTRFPTGDTYSYDLWMSINGASYDNLSGNVPIENETGVLLVAKSATAGPSKDTVGIVVGGTFPDGIVGNTFVNIDTNFKNWVMVDDELMAFESVVSNSDGSKTLANIYRGLLDTVPAAHAVGARVWFLGDSLSRVERNFTVGQAINIKTLTYAGKGVLPIGSAAAKPWTITNRYDKPIVPGNVTINGSFYPTSVTGDLVFTWARRNRLNLPLATWSSADQTPEVDQTTTVKIYGKQGQLIHTSVPQAGTTYTYPQTQELIDAGVVSDLITVELLSVRGGISSFQTFSYSFSRTVLATPTNLTVNMNVTVPSPVVSALPFDLNELA